MKACYYKRSKQHELSLQLAFLLQREIAFFQQAKSPMLVKVVCLFVCLRVFSPNALILKESPKMHGFGVSPTNLYKDKRTIYSFACPNKSKSSGYTINKFTKRTFTQMKFKRKLGSDTLSRRL